MPWDKLPSDNFGVHVENAVDRRRLLWLVNEIGADKLLTSVRKYAARYPGSRPYVSLLLKWHRRRVPTAVYLPVRAPVHAVYLLVLRDLSALKVGYSGNFIGRACQLLPTRYTVDQVFDLDLSVAFETGREELARKLEARCKVLTQVHRVPAPTISRWGDFGIRSFAGGDTEWRRCEVLRALSDLLSNHEAVYSVISLRTALDERQKVADVGFEGTDPTSRDTSH